MDRRELLRKITSFPITASGLAEALLAGIMLYTKSFTSKTGVRTFEAAAVLRNMGADTVSVKKLFASSFDGYKQKYTIIASAKIYQGCAIAVSEDMHENMRIIAPQTADDILDVKHIVASFVLYRPRADEVAVCARSLGDVNVQLIMERLGGGGHQTMAGVQIKDITLGEAEEKLVAAIDDYLETRSGTKQAAIPA